LPPLAGHAAGRSYLLEIKRRKNLNHRRLT
jgi:hypothetical protein